MKLTIKKCNLRGLECEKFLEDLNKRFCPRLLSNVFVGDALSTSTVPSFKCPIRRGEYISSKTLVDMSRVDLLPFDKYKWILTLNFYERDGVSDDEELRPLGCLFLQMFRTQLSNKRRGLNGK